MTDSDIRIQVVVIYNLNLQSWTKECKQIDEIKQNGFFYGMFYS